MSTINERIAEIVRATGKTKTAFAESLGVSQQYISKLEKTGTPSDRTIRDICEKYNVSEGWLRFGEGEMFAKKSRKEQFYEYATKVANGPLDDFKTALIGVLANLDAEQIALLADIADKMVDEYKKEKAGQ